MDQHTTDAALVLISATTIVRSIDNQSTQDAWQSGDYDVTNTGTKRSADEHQGEPQSKKAKNYGLQQSDIVATPKPKSLKR